MEPDDCESLVRGPVFPFKSRSIDSKSDLGQTGLNSPRLNMFLDSDIGQYVLKKNYLSFRSSS